MSVISEEDKINSSLVTSLKAYAALKYNDDSADIFGSVAAAIPDTNLKLQSILKDLAFKLLVPIPNAGEEIATSSAHPNDHVIKYVTSTTQDSMCASVLGHGTSDPISELNYHANMVVLGKHSFVFEKTGRACNVQAFSTELVIAADVQIVDGAIAYECPYTKTAYVLIVSNSLHMPTMEHNLIPPFIMRDGGVIVNDFPKIRCDYTNIEDQCIQFKNSDLKIPMQLSGNFSYFHSRLPTVDELYSCDRLFITPDSSYWRPHCLSFENNERAMLNFEGEIVDETRRDQQPMLFPEREEDMYKLSHVTADKWKKNTNINLSNVFVAGKHDDVINNLYRDFDNALNLKGEASNFAAKIGS